MRGTFREALLCAGIVFVVALILYGWTLAPAVTLVDSGELIVAARSLGVAHPPGFPLYIMLAHLVSLVPIGSVAVRVNFSSALFAALASAMLTLVTAELMRTTPSFAVAKSRRKKKALPREIVPGNSWLVTLAPAFGAGLLFACSRTLWSYATIAEVYTLNTLLILLVIFLMLRWRRRDPALLKHDALLYAAALIFGLALGVHHVTVALILPALAVLVYRRAGAQFFASKRFLFAAAFSSAGLIAVYSYLPFAASRNAVINWGTTRSLREIWWHITGRQYQSFFSFSPELLGHQLLGLGVLVLRQFGPWWLPLALLLAVIGIAYSWKRDRTTFWFLACLVLTNMAYTLGYDIAEDKDAYYLPVFLALALSIGVGLRSLVKFALARKWSAQKNHLLVTLLVLLLPAIALAHNWPFSDRRHYFIGQDYVENIQRTIVPNGLLLTFDWQVQAPMLYTREIERRRCDIKVVDVNLLRRSWYFDYLNHAYPDLLERSREHVDRFVGELKLWEQNPEAYRKDARLAQRIETTFYEMIRAFITAESKSAPIYITSDVIFLTADSDKMLTNWIVKNYQLIPRGLVFELATDRGFHEPGEVQWQTRGLADGTLRFEKDDVVRVKVRPAYTQMLVQRGRYLAFFGQHDRAKAAFEQALVLDPASKPARQGLSESKKTNPVPEGLTTYENVSR